MKLPKPPRVRVTGSSIFNVVGVLAIGYLVVMLGQTIKRNYDLGRQINDLKSQISLLQDQKTELSYDIQYYNTNSFRDRQARSQLGLQLPGENVIIIPHGTPSPTAEPTLGPTKPTVQKSNFQQWIDFLSGHA